MVPQGKFTGYFTSSQQFVWSVNADLNCWVSRSGASLQAGEVWVSMTHGNLFFPWFGFLVFFFLVLQTLEVLVERGKKVLSPTELSQETAFVQSSCRVRPTGILCA